MSPKRADGAVRTALIETAAKLIATEGSSGLTLRRVADEVGTSTMAVYTHFGGMNELRLEVRREGFARLGQHLAGVENTEDPVADLTLLGWAYYLNATTNPNLYRAMFMELPVDEVDEPLGIETFERLVEGVRRCIDARRFRPQDPVHMATQLWSLAHGIASLQLAGFLEPDRALATFADASLALERAFGDRPKASDASLALARRRLGLDGDELVAGEHRSA